MSQISTMILPIFSAERIASIVFFPKDWPKNAFATLARGRFLIAMPTIRMLAPPLLIMRKIICINAINISEYAALALHQGESAIDIVADLAKRLDAEIVAFVAANLSVELPSSWRREIRDEWNQKILVEALDDTAKGYDHALYLQADAPFVDRELIDRMMRLHQQYRAEYTFADGYPRGVAIEIFAASLPRRLHRLCKPEPITIDTLFTIIQRDINSFDIETELAPWDLRHLRLNLACDSRRNWLICKRLLEAGVRDEKTLLDIVSNRGDLLRSLPAYFSIEVTSRHNQRPLYAPPELVSPAARSVANADMPTEMSIANFAAILDKIEDYAPQSMVHLSLWGEIALHSAPGELLSLFNDHPTLRPLVETSGVGWRADDLSRIVSETLNRITWIVAMDCDNAEQYRSLRGEGFEEARKFVDMLLANCPERCYLQAVRMKENESNLIEIYRSWKERANNIIIQKYDHLCGRLPDRKVADITPIERHPCWHLQRDMTILIDGTTPLCREDLAAEHKLGNIFDEDIDAIWQRGAVYFNGHIAKQYPDLCSKCDEYYTYNN